MRPIRVPSLASHDHTVATRLAGFVAGTFTYATYRGPAPDGVPQLKTDILAMLLSAKED